ncbi:MAG TPA: FAD:protein FMN transferase [Acidimicrobiales bacterium]|nr:FAD:protein FMN transferase [Acidimicrobiales bacterium]
MRFSVWGMTGTLAVQDEAFLPEAERRLWHWIDLVDASCNRFRSDSEITRVNQHAGESIVVSGTFERALEAALQASRATEGLCDPTVLPALLALGYDRDFDELRERDVRRQAPVLPRGVGAVHLDTRSHTLVLEPGTQLDLGASAKALCADEIANELEAFGGVVVEIGGDVAVRGAGPQGPWAIGISDTLTVRANAPAITLNYGGVATSSLTTRTWRAGGERVNHIVDPRTGSFAVGPYASATVSASSCVIANAFATAALLWGEDAGYYLAQAGWSARLVRHDDTVEFAGGWPEEART